MVQENLFKLVEVRGLARSTVATRSISLQKSSGRVSFMSIAQERIVTIFGGSRCSEADPEYALAHRVGELLAEAGYVICTGGYLGVM